MPKKIKIGQSIRCKKCDSKLRARQYFVSGDGPFCLSCAKFVRHILGMRGNKECSSADIPPDCPLPDYGYGEWIPVSERLPEKSGEYLFYFPSGYCSVSYFHFSDTGRHLFDTKASHWMPLPKAPEVKK